MDVILVESTPNPNALKFTVDETLLANGSRSFTAIEDAIEDELASFLFGIDGVAGVFYIRNAVTISKEADRAWNEIEPRVRELLSQFRSHEGSIGFASPEEALHGTFQVIDVEQTPNPNALKFVVNAPVLPSGNRSFTNPEQAVGDKLAERLFSLPGVISLFYMQRFVTVTKSSEVSWDALADQARAYIQGVRPDEIPGNNGPNSAEKAPATPSKATGYKPGDNAMVDAINEVLDESIRPALAGDGGGLEILGLDGFNLQISYQGACGTCPSSIAGTLRAIENLLQLSVDPRITVSAAN